MLWNKYNIEDMIKRSKLASPNRGGEGRGRASEQLLSFINGSFEGKIPVPYIIGITKKYNKSICLH
jgi:hypothetical protein